MWTLQCVPWFTSCYMRTRLTDNLETVCRLCNVFRGCYMRTDRHGENNGSSFETLRCKTAYELESN
jgi:hypothetical protein